MPVESFAPTAPSQQQVRSCGPCLLISRVLVPGRMRLKPPRLPCRRCRAAVSVLLVVLGLGALLLLSGYQRLGEAANAFQINSSSASHSQAQEGGGQQGPAGVGRQPALPAGGCHLTLPHLGFDYPELRPLKKQLSELLCGQQLDVPAIRRGYSEALSQQTRAAGAAAAAAGSSSSSSSTAQAQLQRFLQQALSLIQAHGQLRSCPMDPSLLAAWDSLMPDLGNARGLRARPVALGSSKGATSSSHGDPTASNSAGSSTNSSRGRGSDSSSSSSGGGGGGHGSSSSSSRYLFAANAHNSGHTMPNLILQLLQLAVLLPQGGLAVSIYESGSSDLTRYWLNLLHLLLLPLQTPHYLVTGGELKPTKGLERITLLAALRNAALQPFFLPSNASGAASAAAAATARPPGIARLAGSRKGGDRRGGHSSGGGASSSREGSNSPGPQRLSSHMQSGFQPDFVVFVNDVFLCAGDVLRLAKYGADISCGMDFYLAPWDAPNSNHSSSNSGSGSGSGSDGSRGSNKGGGGSQSSSRLPKAQEKRQQKQLLAEPQQQQQQRGLVHPEPMQPTEETQRVWPGPGASKLWSRPVNNAAAQAAAAAGGAGAGLGSGDRIAFGVLKPDGSSAALDELPQWRLRQLGQQGLGPGSRAVRRLLGPPPTASADHLRFYDKWVARDVTGARFSNKPPYIHHLPSQQLLLAGYPVPAYCCWNGMAVLRAEPLQRGLRFRAHQQGECRASECSLLCDDYHRLGFSHVVIDPGVKLVYDFDQLWLVEAGSDEGNARRRRRRVLQGQQVLRNSSTERQVQHPTMAGSKTARAASSSQQQQQQQQNQQGRWQQQQQQGDKKAAAGSSSSSGGGGGGGGGAIPILPWKDVAAAAASLLGQGQSSFRGSQLIMVDCCDLQPGKGHVDFSVDCRKVDVFATNYTTAFLEADAGHG